LQNVTGNYQEDKMNKKKMPVEPFKIKVVEAVQKTPKSERNELLQKAGLNVSNIPAGLFQ